MYVLVNQFIRHVNRLAEYTGCKFCELRIVYSSVVLSRRVFAYETHRFAKGSLKGGVYGDESLIVRAKYSRLIFAI